MGKSISVSRRVEKISKSRLRRLPLRLLTLTLAPKAPKNFTNISQVPTILHFSSHPETSHCYLFNTINMSSVAQSASPSTQVASQTASFPPLINKMLKNVEEHFVAIPDGGLAEEKDYEIWIVSLAVVPVIAVYCMPASA